ncbi:hypothetical protein M0805_001567 [Coniferiporia weirii]|nr:hypothetical protein M0805_001567 [Coniferiporia weirii]
MLHKYSGNVAWDSPMDKGVELAHIINMGLMLQHPQCKIKVSVEETDNSSTSLLMDIINWRAHVCGVFPSVRQLLNNIIATENAEDEHLYLPSDFSNEQHRLFNLTEGMKCELDLRKGQALDAISNLKNVIWEVMVYEHEVKMHMKAFWIVEYHSIWLTLVSLDDRVFWFCHHAAKDRWREEVELQEEELHRAAQGFATLAVAWQNMAKYASHGGKAAFASRKANTY